MARRPPAILTIAGTDSGGGAGIQADLKTFTALGCYGTSVVTALTAQNTIGVHAVHPVPPDFVKQQIKSVLDDIDVHAIKTGMLYDADNVRAVATALKEHYKSIQMPPLICDPVCVSTSGHTLLHPDAVEVLIQDIFPLTTLITPNKSEAELILSHKHFPSQISSLEDMLCAAQSLVSLGPRAVLLKGGHVTVSLDEAKRVSRERPDAHVFWEGLVGENMEILQISEDDPSPGLLVVDVLSQLSGSTSLFFRPRIDSTSTHGTGCTLSAALACTLGCGSSLIEATRQATTYTHQAIETAFPIGKGHGPLNHLHSISLRSLANATPSNPHPLTRFLIQNTSKVWKEYVEHDFVKLLGKGTLPKEHFLHFIKQDYHYLKYYARAYGLLAAKSTAFSSIELAAQTVLSISRESSMHKTMCAQWGISQKELEDTPESAPTTAYGAYLLDAGLQGDTMKLVMALAACLLGYGEVGLWLKREAARPDSCIKIDGNPYKRWIEDYSGEDYQNAVKAGLALIESYAAKDPPSSARLNEWREVWERCTHFEKAFWDMAMELR